MSDSLAQDRIELEVNDFGPVVEARIDLRPLTVFVGPSNTGKSYLAILIYALHRHFNGGDWSGGRGLLMRSRMFREGRSGKPSRETIDRIMER